MVLGVRLFRRVIQCHKGTNHLDKYRWDVDYTPDWFNYCVVDTEVNYNPNENNCLVLEKVDS